MSLVDHLKKKRKHSAIRGYSKKSPEDQEALTDVWKTLADDLMDTMGHLPRLRDRSLLQWKDVTQEQMEAFMGFYEYFFGVPSTSYRKAFEKSLGLSPDPTGMVLGDPAYAFPEFEVEGVRTPTGLTEMNAYRLYTAALSGGVMGWKGLPASHREILELTIQMFLEACSEHMDQWAQAMEYMVFQNKQMQALITPYINHLE